LQHYALTIRLQRTADDCGADTLLLTHQHYARTNGMYMVRIYIYIYDVSTVRE